MTCFGWIGAWLGSPVLGYWVPPLSIGDTYIIPALIGALVEAFASEAYGEPVHGIEYVDFRVLDSQDLSCIDCAGSCFVIAGLRPASQAAYGAVAVAAAACFRCI